LPKPDHSHLNTDCKEDFNIETEKSQEEASNNPQKESGSEKISPKIPRVIRVNTE
jgi:hypothetical protein